MINKERLISDIRKLRTILFILTIIDLLYIVLTFQGSSFWIDFDSAFYLDIILGISNLFLATVFLWYNWKQLPVSKSQKTDNTWKILILGIVGMWLWIPNKAEINRMFQ